MNRFTELYQTLDRAAGSKAREAALQCYFENVDSAEASWAIHVLGGGKVNTGRYRIAKTTEMREWVAELTALPHGLWKTAIGKWGTWRKR
ncbi:hypothetical protein [Diaphorobacter aerolatus]|uniref:hypothetical protein n=1 Tax=Diaphorobacter aerolatus TaxID=1288495 RepID=UPI001D02C98B|nr:hypothetical protein [Diaphorobacter aerolatus]